MEFKDGIPQCGVFRKNNLEVQAMDLINYYTTKNKVLKGDDASFSRNCHFQLTKQVLILIMSVKRAFTLPHHVSRTCLFQ